MLSAEEQQYYMIYMKTKNHVAMKALWNQGWNNRLHFQKLFVRIINTQQNMIYCITNIWLSLNTIEENSEEINDYIKSMQISLFDIKSKGIEHHTKEAKKLEDIMMQLIEVVYGIAHGKENTITFNRFEKINQTIENSKAAFLANKNTMCTDIDELNNITPTCNLDEQFNDFE